jgi:hypothetical protein
MSKERGTVRVGMQEVCRVSKSAMAMGMGMAVSARRSLSGLDPWCEAAGAQLGSAGCDRARPSLPSPSVSLCVQFHGMGTARGRACLGRPLSLQWAFGQILFGRVSVASGRRGARDASAGRGRPWMVLGEERIGVDAREVGAGDGASSNSMTRPAPRQAHTPRSLVHSPNRITRSTPPLGLQQQTLVSITLLCTCASGRLGARPATGPCDTEVERPCSASFPLASFLVLAIHSPVLAIGDHRHAHSRPHSHTHSNIASCPPRFQRSEYGRWNTNAAESVAIRSRYGRETTQCGAPWDGRASLSTRLSGARRRASLVKALYAGWQAAGA